MSFIVFHIFKPTCAYVLKTHLIAVVLHFRQWIKPIFSWWVCDDFFDKWRNLTLVLCQYHQWLLLWLDPWLFALAAASFFACFAAFIWSRCCWARSRLFMPEKRFSRAFRLHLILRHARILTQPLAQCRVKCKKVQFCSFGFQFRNKYYWVWVKRGPRIIWQWCAHTWVAKFHI